MKYLPNKHKSTSKNDGSISGQALLLVLLVMAVVLTLVLSVVSRSMTDISLTTRDEESLRAFSAAEAGIERMIVGGDAAKVGTLDTGSYSGDVEEYGEGASGVSYPEIESGESGTIWFVEHAPDGKLVCDDGCFTGNVVDICWGGEETPAPAIEVSFFYDVNAGGVNNALTGDYSGVQVARAAYDSLYQSRENSFTDPAGTGCTIDSITYEFNTNDIIGALSPSIACDLSEPGCLLFAKVKMFYNDEPHEVGVKVSADNGGHEYLPSQGRSIESTGTSGDATAKVIAFQSFQEPLDIFESALFSTSGLVKSN